MAYAINIRSDAADAQGIRALWPIAGELEASPSMEALGYPPHLTLAVFDELDVLRAQKVLQEVFNDLPKQHVRFDTLDRFETPDSIVLWARPNRVDDLLVAHHRIHELMGAAHSYSNYRPGHWVPHCSLATAVPYERRDDVIEIVRRGIAPVEVTFDFADLVSFPPVEILVEQALA